MGASLKLDKDRNLGSSLAFAGMGERVRERPQCSLCFLAGVERFLSKSFLSCLTASFLVPCLGCTGWW